MELRHLSYQSNEIYDENAATGSVANLMYSLIERFVLSVIDETFELEDLSEIAETLFLYE